MTIKNFDDAKRLIDLPLLLDTLGYKPDQKKSRPGDIWYASPFRNEDHASFHIRKGQKGFWLWKDFGGTGGTVIDFVMKLKNYSNPRDALIYLQEWHQGAPLQPSFRIEQLDKHSEAPQSMLKLKKVRSLRRRDRHQVYYVVSRRIDPLLAFDALLHITYRNSKLGKDFYAVGLENIKGGYEIRSGGDFKSCIGPKAISVMGSDEPVCIHVVEGMFDYLSLLSIQGRLEGQTIIMNSTSLMKEAVAHIVASGVTSVKLYLDNDKTGRDTTQRFHDALLAEGIPCYDMSNLYAQYEDLNEYLKHGPELQG